MKLASAAKDAYGCVMRMSEIAKLLAWLLDIDQLPEKCPLWTEDAKP